MTAARGAVKCSCIAQWTPRRPLSTARPPAQKTKSAPALLRQVMRSTAQPVAVITACIPTIKNGFSTTGPPNHGATLSSLSSVSLSPPLVAFSLRLPSRLASYLLPSSSSSKADPPTLTVHLLSSSQEHVARAFARQLPLPSPATPSPPPSPPNSPPLLDEPSFSAALFSDLSKSSLGILTCTLVHSIPLSELKEGGDVKDGPRSELFIARVDEVEIPEPGGEEDRGSLVYWEQGYHAVVGPR